MSADIAGNLAAVRARIDEAARRAGRSPDEVTLVAISKTFAADVCRRAIETGVTDLGENRAQELREKAALLPAARWHFVGYLQTNKVRHVVGTARLIHSVDRDEVAEAIAERSARLGIVQDVLIEVNLAREEAKHGVDPERAQDLARAVEALGGIALRGLMTMPPVPESPEDSRPYFRELASLLHDVRSVAPGAHHLSMGMTRDHEIAVEEGATLVRIGEAIFGPRTRA